MLNSTKYHFGKAYYVLNLIKGLKDYGVPVQKIIDRSKLRYFRIVDPEQMLPLEVIYDFFEQVQEDQGIRDMAKTFFYYYSLKTIGAYGSLLASSKRMLPIILSGLKYGKINLSHTNYTFDINGDTSYFGNHYKTKPCKGQDFLNSIDLGLQMGSMKMLKRHLAAEQINYHEILERWRFMKGVNLLTETNLKIKEISDCLYYANSANFVRAFKRWSGKTPMEYRTAS